MALPRPTITEGFQQEYADFAALLRTLDDEDWEQPSRCEGWRVADVAAHVSGTLASVVAGRLEGLGNPEVTAQEVDERRGRTPAQLADELDASATIAKDLLGGFDDDGWNAPVGAGLPGTVGEGVEALWYDAYLHADDIRAATGRPTERGPGLEASVSHVAQMLDNRGWGPATVALDGATEYKVRGGGRKVTGDAHAFVLAATGRGDGKPYDVPNIYAA